MNRAALRKTFKDIRTASTSWLAKGTMEHLEVIRRYELDIIRELLPKHGKLLEIGAGTGWQAQTLSEHGYEVNAIDIPSSNYRAHRVRTVIDYNGKVIPFADNTFDLVFSSNVLEHISHVRAFQKEINRVLKPDGQAIHVLPSGSWRLWTNLAHLLRCWTPPVCHGVHASNPLTEIFYFNRRHWTKLFQEAGWKIAEVHSNRIFYTGHSLMDKRLSLKTRHNLSLLLGSSGNIFVLKKKTLTN